MLKVKADVPGVNYSDEFELPVFRTLSSASEATTFAGGTQIASFSQTSTMISRGNPPRFPTRRAIARSSSPSRLLTVCNFASPPDAT